MGLISAIGTGVLLFSGGGVGAVRWGTSDADCGREPGETHGRLLQAEVSDQKHLPDQPVHEEAIRMLHS